MPPHLGLCLVHTIQRRRGSASSSASAAAVPPRAEHWLTDSCLTWTASAFGRRHGFVTACVRQQSRSRAAMGRDRDRPYRRSRGRRESRGRTGAEQRPLGSGPRWAQERQTSDAYDAEPMLPAALQYGPLGIA